MCSLRTTIVSPLPCQTCSTKRPNVVTCVVIDTCHQPGSHASSGLLPACIHLDNARAQLTSVTVMRCVRATYMHMSSTFQSFTHKENSDAPCSCMQVVVIVDDHLVPITTIDAPNLHPHCLPTKQVTVPNTGSAWQQQPLICHGAASYCWGTTFVAVCINSYSLATFFYRKFPMYIMQTTPVYILVT